ncbi:E3 ubiquitin ligase PARAQUAT TOLERANCE 3 isoform X1 [Selaginella moellendorffii]|uniref:E3 ubiquitin ligase PARAQUAT TOLERANCE 3 isoform X1 n=1 Tax=Selaginella moellendorffii TaxID=88036 RepID=UPI000D1D0A36|nr:E3 ubiquitin ligase PARAQUAT TOLERANCE 3 isoform X1 [Selaginella moellendorffii]|eukprot:XP_024525023.1 E3 ubiquitin ligase PARAQUAT TOLERANCE 3 isoform X1 [Selaginella moellendorffii]
MAMAVHYKFKSAKDFDSVPIDEHCISIGKLKEKILLKLKLGNASSDFDLVVSKPDTDEEYLDEEFMLWENTSVLVRRVPRKAIVQEAATEAGKISPVCITSEEDDRIKEFVDSSAAEWLRQTNENQGPGGSGSSFQKKVPHQGYICHRCGVAGHFIQHCPTNGDPSYDVKKMKMPSGIPRTMLVANPDGSYALPTGEAAAMQPNEDAFAKEIEGVIPSEPITDVPSELRCPLCQNALKDAVLTSKCCFKSYCDTCIRNVLLEKTTCVCGAKNIRADDLLPNKTLRETVDRLLSGAALPLVNTTKAEKPQSQASADSTTTHVAVADGKADEGKDEFEDVEEVDYDEEGFDDLNIDDLDIDGEQSEKTPESDATKALAEAVEDKRSPDVAVKSKEEIHDQPETKMEMEGVEPSKRSDDRQVIPKQRSDGRGNPYAVQYAGYWSASHMIGDPACRPPPYGYAGYFPGCFPAPAQFPFQPFPGPKSSNRPLSREEFEARKADIQRNRGHTNRNRVRGEGFYQMPDRRGGRHGRAYKPRSKSPPRRRRSPDRQRLQSSSPPRRESTSPPKSRPRRSMSPARRSSPARRRQSPVARSHHHHDHHQLSPRLRSRSKSPPRPLRSAGINRRPPPHREMDTSRWSPQRCRRYGVSKVEEKFSAKEVVRESASMSVREWHGGSSRGFVDLSPRREREMMARDLYDDDVRLVGRAPEERYVAPSKAMVVRPTYIDDNENGLRRPPVVRKKMVARMAQRESFGVMRRPGGGVVDGIFYGMEVPARRTKSVLRAARGASAELLDDVLEDRRYIEEEETRQRPVVALQQRMQRKKSLMLVRAGADDEEDEDEVPVTVQRRAVFARPDGLQRQRCLDEEEEEDEQWIVHRTSKSCMPRKRQRALGPRAKAMARQRMALLEEEEEEVDGGGGEEYDEFDEDDNGMDGNEEDEEMEVSLPMKRRRLLAKQRALLQQQAGNLAMSRGKRKKMKAGQAVNGGGAQNNNQCKIVKSVFERISFTSTANTNRAGKKKLTKSGGGGGSGGGPRTVVFYGDVS